MVPKLKIVNSGAAGDIHFGEIHMAKKREHRGGWGMQTRLAKMGAPAARRAAMEDARAKRPALHKKIRRIKKRAKALTSPPPYGINDYLVELFEIAYSWGMVRPYMLRTLAKQHGRKIKAKTNEWVMLINVTSNFTKQRASKLGGKLAYGLKNHLSPAEFEAYLLK